VAQFRNVSGVDRHLHLPDWYAPRLVEAGAVIDIEDALVYSGPPTPRDGEEIPVDHHVGTYDFNQVGIWERVDSPSPRLVDDKKNGSES
jgi:hypothetical protein